MTTTATVEKLLLQVFDAKNRIKQQVKQQTDFYTQHLASKLLVDGITPPSWLWNDSQSSDAPKELSKEDLISEILLPHPPPTIHFPSASCSLYNKPVAAGDYRVLVNGVSNETYSCSKCLNDGDKQAIAANTVSTTNMMPGLDVSIISPLVETEGRILNIFSAPDQSVARIQRSKSRQKALELRNSAKADRLNQKNETIGSPARTRLSVFRTEQDQLLDFQEFSRPCTRRRDCSGGVDLNAERKNFCTGIVTRSRGSGKQPCSMEEFQKGDSITDILQKTSCSLGKDVRDFRQWPDLVNVSLELINSDVTAKRCGLTEARKDGCSEAEEKGTDSCVGRISRASFSSRLPCSMNEAPELDVSIHSTIDDGGIVAQSNDRSVQQFNDANDFLDVTKHSVELVHKRTRSQTPLGNGGMPILLDTSNAAHNIESSSICGATENSQAANYEVQISSDANIILPFADAHNVLDQQGNFEIVVGHDPVKDLHANSRSTSDDAGLQCLISKSSWDYSVLMEPKQLYFDDTKECNLKDNSKTIEESYNLEKSPDKAFDTSFHPASSLTDQVKYGDMISENELIVEPGVSTKEDEIHGSSFEFNTDNHDDIKNKKDDVYDYSTQNTVAVDSEATLHVSNVEFTCQTNIVESNVVETPNSESHVIPYCKEVSEPELLHSQGDYACKRKEESTHASQPSESKHFRSSDRSCSAKEAPGLLEERLIKEVGTLGPANIIFDATGQHCVDENQNLSCLGFKPCSESITNVSGSQRTIESSSLGRDDLFTCGSFGSRPANHENFDVLRSGELQIAMKSVFERNLRYIEVDSWPRSKRRKIQDQETDCFSAPQSFMVKKQCASQRGSRSMKLKKVVDEVETVPGYASLVNESAEIEIYPEMARELTEGMESLSKLQTKESALNSEELAEHGETSSLPKLGKLGRTGVSKLNKDPARVSQGYSTEEISRASTSIDARKDCDEEDNQHYLEGEGNWANSEGLMERGLLAENYYLGADGQLSCGFVQSLAKKDLDLTGAEETMPDLEGFIIDPQTEDKEINIPGHLINFDKLESPRTSIEHTSVLEQIRKSTVIQTPSTQLSSAFSLPGSQKFCHSIPNGLLECMGLRSVSPINEVVDDKLRVRGGCNGNDHLKKLSYSDFPPSPRARFGLDSRITYASPVGKLWERIFLHSGSSEKQLNSNPELVCFTIEEDPSISEENEKASELTDKMQEGCCSLIDSCTKREPLADITEANAATSISAGEKFVNRDSEEYVDAKIRLKGPHIKVKQEQLNYNKNKSEEKENNVLPLANGTMKAKESTSSRFSKANSSRKTSLKIERQKLSEKKAKRNNIVSNVTSFIPLVQHKQAAAVCAGKRDVKVKALEAAEAAKRLEEKRQNERQMRKEALKLERARVEQENLRQMELNKKMKEEEKKKRDADIVARKRLREEEEKKAKERKRKRIAEAQRLQKEGGTLCSQKVEREKQFVNIDKGDYRTKESENPQKRNQTMVKESREEISFQKLETNQRPDECPAHFQEAGVSVEACGTAGDSSIDEKTMPTLAKSGEMDDLIVQKSPEKSYDISPYQCSDDEEDEEENIPRKFIPSWASKNCVALVLPLQQGIEPEVIFPPESFCSVDKLVLEQKQKA